MNKRPGVRTEWTYFMDTQLREMWRYHSCREIAEAMDLTVMRIWARARKLNLPKKTCRKFREPDIAVWERAARQAAIQGDVEAKEILAGGKRHPVARARWRAFKIVLDADPRVSMFGLSRVSGFDRTSIAHGLKRLAGATVEQTRLDRATGRHPSRNNSILQAAE